MIRHNIGIDAGDARNQLLGPSGEIGLQREKL